MRIFLFCLIFNFVFLRVQAQELNIEFFDNFNDEYLKGYVELALENNHDLNKTKHILEQHRLEIKKQFANEFPYLSVQSNYFASHIINLTKPIFNASAYILPFMLQYEPDFLLKNHDKTKMKKINLECYKQNQRAIKISYITDVATHYVNLIMYDSLINLQEKILYEMSLKLKLTKLMFLNGIADKKEINEIQEECKKTEAKLYELIKSQNNIIYDFCVLLAESSDNFKNVKRAGFSKFEYIKQIPLYIESDVIFSRPDVKEIENKLKAAKLDITIAKKDFLPTFKIFGVYVFNTISGSFFSWDSSFALLVAGLTQDIFKGGEKIANLKNKKAKYLELIEEYKQTDLNAVKEINSALNLIKQYTREEKAQKEKLILKNEDLKIELNRYEKGISSKLDVIEAKKEALMQEQRLIELKANRLISYFALYKATAGKI